MIALSIWQTISVGVGTTILIILAVVTYMVRTDR